MQSVQGFWDLQHRLLVISYVAVLDGNTASENLPQFKQMSLLGMRIKFWTSLPRGCVHHPITCYCILLHEKGLETIGLQWEMLCKNMNLYHSPPPTSPLQTANSLKPKKPKVSKQIPLGCSYLFNLTMWWIFVMKQRLVQGVGLEHA